LIGFHVERLAEHHDIADFTSSNPELTKYLLEDALVDQRQFVSVTHLLFSEDGEILGYFTLLTDSIRIDKMDKNYIPDGHHYSSLPALKIGRLSTSKSHEREGWGTEMVSLCIDVLIEIRKDAGCKVMTVDSKSGCEGFYESIGFERTSNRRDGSTQMYLMVNHDRYSSYDATEP
jgi:predicted GNAT family N-acyltransferase